VLTQHELVRLLADPRVPGDVRDRGLALLSGDLSESVGFIRNAVQHLANIIDGLLRLSRVGRVEYQREPVDVNALVGDILASMRTTIAASGATVRVEALPVIHADRNAIGQVFANIVGNAVKCLHPDRQGVIRIAATGDDPPVFIIEDNGIGIPEEYRKKIFQVFQHVHAAEGRGEGMGLAIVRRIVERHGGRIWFESTAQAGTRFFFTLAPAPGTSAPASAEATA
jgi:signal transduction histidine kinase